MGLPERNHRLHNEIVDCELRLRCRARDAVAVIETAVAERTSLVSASSRGGQDLRASATDPSWCSPASTISSFCWTVHARQLLILLNG